MSERKETTCNRDCADACRIVATLEEGRIVRLQGDRAHPVTQGFLCYRTSHFLERQYHPKRLRVPLWRKDKDTAFSPISFDDAIALAAEQLLRIRAESGPGAIFHYRSGGSLGHVKLVVDRFWEHFGPVTLKRGDICTGAGDDAQLRDFGALEANDLEDLQNARTIVLWGKNVVTASPHTLPFLKRARERGARLLLIDPLHQRTAQHCDAWIQPRPGGDLSLALALGRLLAEDSERLEAARVYCDGVEAFASLCREQRLEEWVARAGVTRTDVELLYRALTEGAPCTAFLGWGMGRRVNGSTIVRAIDAVFALSGNIGVPGAGVSYYFNRKSALDGSVVEGRAARHVREPLFGDDLAALRDPPIRALWVTAGNPVAMLPDSEKTRTAIRATEFVVVVDSFLTDTAACANLVFPAATLLEDDDVMGAYGHHYLGTSQPLVSPLGESRSDLSIIQALAARCGLADAVAGDARSWKRRLVEPPLAPAGLGLADLEARPVRNPLAPRIVYEHRRFATPNGKAQLLDALGPDAFGLPDDPTFPLYLMSCATPDSQSSQWVREPEDVAPCTVHPDVAPGIGEGELARLESCLASMTVRVRFDSRQRRDVAIVPKGGHLASGHAANRLVRARLTDAGEGAALYDERVRLVPWSPA